MSRAAPLCMAGVLICSAGAAPAAASQVSADLSENVIQISSSFSGKRLTLFGAIEGLPTDEGVGDGWDVVVVVRGPDMPVTVRRKERVAGVWMNRRTVRFANVPGFYFVASSRPLSKITSETALQRNGVGFANLAIDQEGPDVPESVADVFRAAVTRHQRNQGLLAEAPEGVSFRSGALFRTEIDFPAVVPVGEYRVEVHLLREGQFVDAQTLPLFVNKTGIERTIYELAHDSPLLYGVMAVLIALGAGWLASLPFRRK